VFHVVVPRGLRAARTLRSVRSPLGAPPWRFLVPGSPRVPSGSTGPVAQASPHQPLWPGRRHRASEAAVANPRSRTPHPLRHQDRLRRRPSSSGIMHTILDAICSQYLNSRSSSFFPAPATSRRPHLCRGNGTIKWIGFPRIVCAQDRHVGPIPTAKADQPRSSRPRANTPFRRESKSSGSFP
jgi:hypothetical protein